MAGRAVPPAYAETTTTYRRPALIYEDLAPTYSTHYYYAPPVYDPRPPAYYDAPYFSSPSFSFNISHGLGHGWRDDDESGWHRGEGSDDAQQWHGRDHGSRGEHEH